MSSSFVLHICTGLLDFFCWGGLFFVLSRIDSLRFSITCIGWVSFPNFLGNYKTNKSQPKLYLWCSKYCFVSSFWRVDVWQSILQESRHKDIFRQTDRQKKKGGKFLNKLSCSIGGRGGGGGYCTIIWFNQLGVITQLTTVKCLLSWRIEKRKWLAPTKD